MASMAEYQVTYWRAMRAGASDADAYLADWRREDWQQRDGDPGEVAATVAKELDEGFPVELLNQLVEASG